MTGWIIAKVPVLWQSVVGGSATTAKFNVPPRLGVCAAAGAAAAAAATEPAKARL
jgi:hypothetical protein